MHTYFYYFLLVLSLSNCSPVALSVADVDMRPTCKKCIDKCNETIKNDRMATKMADDVVVFTGWPKK